MGSEISKLPHEFSTAIESESQKITSQGPAPLTLSSSSFAGEVRGIIRSGATAFMASVGFNLPGANIEEPLEARKHLARLIQEVTLRVMIAVEDSKAQGLSLKETKNLIAEASRINEHTTLIPAKSFVKTSLAEIHARCDDDNYWRYRIAAAVRAEIIGVKTGQEISEALERVASDPELRQVFQDLDGYRVLSHLYTRGNMLIAQLEMSKACKGESLNLRKEMAWSVLPGSTQDLKIMTTAVLSDFEKLKTFDGYRRFAREYAGGRMQKAYAYVRAICQEHDLPFDDLGWCSFQGTVDKFDEVVREVDKAFAQNQITSNFLFGIAGYKTFSLRFADGNMLRAHQLASVVSKYLGHSFKDLGWFQFPGSVNQFEELASIIKDDFSKCMGSEGQQVVAASCTDGDLKNAYSKVQAVCRLQNLPFKELNWHRSLPEVLEPAENIGPDLKLVARIFHEQGGFKNTPVDLNRLAQQAKETMQIIAALKERSLGQSSILSNLSGVEGHKAFAREFSNGQMLKAFTTVSSICKMQGENFDHLGWVVFAGSVEQFEYIQDGIAKLKANGKLYNLLTIDISDRLPQLINDMQEISPAHKKLLINVQPKDFYSALPEKLSAELSKQHFSVGYLRLDVDGASVYFDSNPERICGYLLHKYGLIDKFVEGKNLHVRANNINRINLDFFIESKKLFIEYHPLSISEIYSGVTLEQAGLRKTDSIKHGKYSDCRAIHISDFDGLYEVLTKELGLELSPAQFKKDISQAQAYGYQCDEIHETGHGQPDDEAQPESFRSDQ
jgi:hypothetical protein